MKSYRLVKGVYTGPEHHKGDLNFGGCERLKDLGCLVTVSGYLNLVGTGVTSLKNLASLTGYLHLRGTSIESLGDLFWAGMLILPSGSMIKDIEQYRANAQWVMKNLPLEDYPLHIKHENWFVRTRVNRTLSGEVYKDWL